MGKVISNKELIQKTVNDYLDTSNKYSKYLEGAPTFVTYYSYNKVDSTTDAGLENVLEVVGAESPVKYKKILEFPVYGLNQMSPNIEVTEFGLSSSIENELIILPNTIKPHVHDFFEVAYDTTKKLYEITEVQYDKLNTGVQFIRCMFNISTKSIDQLEQQVPDGHVFDVAYDNIGTDSKVIIQSDYFELLDTIDIIRKKIFDFYDKTFRHKKFNVLCYNLNGVNVLDKYLHEFIKKNELLHVKNPYFNAMTIEEINFDKDLQFIENYQNTIFYGIESKNFNNVTDSYYLKLIESNYRLPFFQYYEDFYYLEYVLGNTDRYNNNVVQSIFNKTFFNNVKNNKLYNNNISHGLYNIIIKYINRTDTSFNKDDMNYIVDILVNYNNYYCDISTYMLLPCILYILKEIETQITRKISRKDTSVYV